VAAGLALAPAADAQSVQLTPFGGQNFTTPFHVAAPPGDTTRVFVVEAAGRIRLVKAGVTQPTAFLDVNADVLDIGESGCECGMFSMAFAPDYATSGLFYVFYTRDDPTPGNQHVLVIEEFRRSAANPDLADPATRRIVLEIPHLTASNHNGGQLQFGPDGFLYISVGDGGNTPQLAQDLTSRLGKLLRIDPRDPIGPDAYSIPPGNPFADGPGGSADEIYAYGLRNPYRFSFDRLTGALTIGDVGGGTNEEIDHAAVGTASGDNYGWPCFEGTDPLQNTGFCAPPGLTNHTPPVFEYQRPPMSGAAINGGFVVRDLTVPSLTGRYVYADSSGALGTTIHAIDVSPSGASGDGAIPGVSAGGVVSFGEDACAHVYVVQIGGPVSRIEPSGGTTACAPQLPASGPSKGPPPVPRRIADSKPPALEVRTHAARHAGKLGEVRLIVRCDEVCAVEAAGRIALPGRDIRLAPESVLMSVAALHPLRLPLSAGQERRLSGVVAEGSKARAILSVKATDEAGNVTRVVRRVKQKP
jgi:glucose/arabinose dehydrogenase